MTAADAEMVKEEEEEGAAAGTTTIGRAGAEVEAAADTTTIAIIGTIAAAVAEVAEMEAAAIRAGATLRIKVRLPLAMTFRGEMTMAAEEVVPLRVEAAAAMAAVEEVQDPDEDRREGRLLAAAAEEEVALEGGIKILAVDLVGVVAAGEEAEAKEEVEVLDAVAEEAIATTARTTTNLFPRKHGGCSSSPTSPSNT